MLLAYKSQTQRLVSKTTINTNVKYVCCMAWFWKYLFGNTKNIVFNYLQHDIC